MKKFFLFFLTVGVLTSCSKDDSGNNPIDSNCKVIEWKFSYDEGDGFFDGGSKKIFYDNQNRISKVESYYDGDSFTTTYSYSDKMIIVSSPVQKVVYTLNSENLIEKYDIEGYNSVKIGYNSANQMISAQRSGSKLYTFIYSGGNLINATEGDENFSFTYDTSQSFPPFGSFGLDPFYHLFGDTDYEASHVLYEQGYFGAKIKNAIKTYNGNYTSRTYSYSYSNGKISSYGREDEKYDLIYSCK